MLNIPRKIHMQNTIGSSETYEDDNCRVSWIEAYESILGEPLPKKCPRCGSRITKEKPLEGCHVCFYHAVCEDDETDYIIPMCHACNKTDKDFYVDAKWLIPLEDVERERLQLTVVKDASEKDK